MRLRSLKNVSWIVAGIAGLGLAIALLWMDNRTYPTGTSEVPPFRAAFELTDHRGIVRTEDDFAGRWMLVFFGFANCPDVCPTTLSEVPAVIDGLGDEADKVQPIFISIDPERDTPQALAEFVPLFDESIIGLTGTPGQIAGLAETFPIYFERIEEATAPDGYTMGHTSHLILFGPDAGFADSWPYGTPAEEILADLRERI